MVKRRNPLPSIFPLWFQERAEVDNHRLYEFMAHTSQLLSGSDWVLDAGAGEGKYKEDFAHTRYVGVDLGVGDTQWDYSGLDVISTLEALGFADAVFDAVLCTQVLEHVPEPHVVLEELWRVLRSGGQLFLSAPQSWHQHQKPHDYYRYTSFGLRYLLERSGFEVLSIDNMGGYFWFLSFQLQMINYWAFPKGERGRLLTLPFRALFGFFFQLICPLVLFYLDRFDRIKDETFGYVCVARKPIVKSEG